MDADTVDREYAQLEQQAQQTSQLVQALAGKLQAAADGGDQNAREWMLDLKEIAVGLRDEEGQTSLLLQAIHTMIDNHVQQGAPDPAYQQGNYQQAGYQQAGYQQGGYQQGGYPQGGGMLQRFLGGGFGRAMVTGAGFGIGDDIIQHLF